jgi:hypothetical protein
MLLLKMVKNAQYGFTPPLSIGEYSNNWYQSRFFKNSLTIRRQLMEFMKCTDNGTPMFDGKNYEIWNTRMKVFIEE